VCNSNIADILINVLDIALSLIELTEQQVEVTCEGDKERKSVS